MNSSAGREFDSAPALTWYAPSFTGTLKPSVTPAGSISSPPQPAAAKASTTNPAGRTNLNPFLLICKANLTDGPGCTAHLPERCRRSAPRSAEWELDQLGGRSLVSDRDAVAGSGLATHDSERNRAEGGGDAGGPDASERALAEPDLLTGSRRPLQAQPPQMAVRLPPVVQAGHRLLADVAALGEADRALVDSGLRGDRGLGHLCAEPRPPGLHAEDLRRRF